MSSFNLKDLLEQGLSEKEIILELINSKNSGFDEDPLTIDNVIVQDPVDISEDPESSANTEITIEAQSGHGYRGQTSFKYNRMVFDDFINGIVGTGGVLYSYYDDNVEDIIDIIEETYAVSIDKTIVSNLDQAVDIDPDTGTGSATIKIKSSSLLFQGTSNVLLKASDFNPAEFTVDTIDSGNASVYVTGGATKLTVDWGDGVEVSRTNNGTLSKSFSPYEGLVKCKVTEIEGDDLTVKIYGDPVISVNSFGTFPDVSRVYFQGASNLLSGPNYLPPNITNMGYMFQDCSNFNQDLSGWDVSNVTAMNNMFQGCSNFNSDLSGWDVSKITNHRSFNTGGILTSDQMPKW